MSGRGNIITSVEPDSPLDGRVFPGERLVSLSGHDIADVLDYMYYGYGARVGAVVENASGKRRVIRVRKREGEDLGLSFETYLMDGPRGCSNRCVFCFVDQLPKGMRKTLYFKDDDVRLSFLTGNYVTLTNLAERDIRRICELRLSPINISVHATEPSLRARLLGNPEGASGYALMCRLAKAGIVMNCQIVCCPGLNDGAALSRSMRDLAALHPAVNSVSVVPVGLTKYREGLEKLVPFDALSAASVIDEAEAFGTRCLERCGSRIFFPADEFYLKAERPIPDEAWYEDFPQLENGVGMLRLFQSEFAAELEFAAGSLKKHCVSVATGEAAIKFLQKVLLTAKEKYANIEVSVYAVKNDFFGHSIDVAGLITGRDLIAQLRGRALGERLYIPSSMLRNGEGVFLDDVTLEDAERELAVPVTPLTPDGGSFFQAVFGAK